MEPVVGDTRLVGVLAPDPAAVALTSDEAREARTELDRMVLANPERARLRIADALAASAEDTVRRGFDLSYAAFNRRDWELNTLLLDRGDYVFHAADLSELLPDASERYHGIAGYLEAMNLFLESWSELEVGLVDLLDLSPVRAVTLMHFRGRGRRSGAPFERLALGDHVFREGLCVNQSYWWDSQRGARELGLQLPRTRR
jgi:hypothetical protein